MSSKLLRRLLIIITFCFGYCEDLLAAEDDGDISLYPLLH